jgi:hypothetical protein
LALSVIILAAMAGAVYLLLLLLQWRLNVKSLKREGIGLNKILDKALAENNKHPCYEKRQSEHN